MTILKTAPDGANVLDLAGARAGRAEARALAGESNPVLKIDAGYLELKPEIDITTSEDFLAGQTRVALSKLLVDPADVDALLSAGLSTGDLEAITKFVAGATPGE